MQLGRQIPELNYQHHLHWHSIYDTYNLFNDAVKPDDITITKMIVSKRLFGKHVAGSGGGLIRSAIPTSSFMDWRDKHKPGSGQLVSTYFTNSKCKGHRLRQIAGYIV
jgi:hypothetical protein